MNRYFANSKLVAVAVILWWCTGLPAFGAPEESDRLELQRAIEHLSGAPDEAPLVRLEIDGRQRELHRCGTPAVSRDEVAAALRGPREMAEVFDQAKRLRKRVDIPLVFHVLQDKDGDGVIDQAQLDEQMSVVNKAFKKSKLRFFIQEVRYLTKPNWFKRCAKAKVATKMAKRLAVDPARTVNVYTCEPKKLLGFAILPWAYEEDSVFNQVVVHHLSMPFGIFPYDLGMTLVHELGHYFGLLHPFSGGCEAPGDFVDDTPFEAEPARRCPIGKDSCPQEGVDPVENYMDYSDDACFTNFTAGQNDRMREVSEFYRPTLFAKD